LFPLYWGAYSAALRLSVEREGLELGAITDLSLIDRAYSEGIVSFEHYESARRLLSLRNEVVHTFEATVTDDDLIELRKSIAELVDELT
jgi:hypothetical protein